MVSVVIERIRSLVLFIGQPGLIQPGRAVAVHKYQFIGYLTLSPVMLSQQSVIKQHQPLAGHNKGSIQHPSKKKKKALWLTIVTVKKMAVITFTSVFMIISFTGKPKSLESPFFMGYRILPEAEEGTESLKFTRIFFCLGNSLF